MVSFSFTDSFGCASTEKSFEIRKNHLAVKKEASEHHIAFRGPILPGEKERLSLTSCQFNPISPTWENLQAAPLGQLPVNSMSWHNSTLIVPFLGVHSTQTAFWRRHFCFAMPSRTRKTVGSDVYVNVGDHRTRFP